MVNEKVTSAMAKNSSSQSFTPNPTSRKNGYQTKREKTATCLYFEHKQGRHLLGPDAQTNTFVVRSNVVGQQSSWRQVDSSSFVYFFLILEG